MQRLMQSYGGALGAQPTKTTLVAIVNNFSLFKVNPIITHIH